MSTNGNIHGQSRMIGGAIGIGGAFCLVGFLVWVMYSYTKPEEKLR